MLILCPNLVLCEQVHQVIERVFNSSSNGDKAMIRSTVVSSKHPPPYQFPDVVITTPGALFSLIFESGGALGHEWTRDGFAELIRYVVLDECDMLLGGSFGKQIEQILEMLRTGDRQRAARRACEEIGVDLEAYWTLPRHLRKAAQLQGGKGLVEEGVEDFLKVSVNLQESSTWLRQYAFVAATIPSEGKETIGARIKRDYPEAIWLSSDGVHKLLNTVEFRWREVAGLDEKIDEIMVSHTCSVNSICFQFKRATVFPAGYDRGFGSKRKCRQNTCVCRQFKVRTIDCIKVVWDCKW
jgi:superfamily II DNA/RNA helicase